MGTIKKKKFWLMFFILGLGTVLRFWHLDKAEGLWNDEYLSWMIASVPLGKKFIQEVIAQCHMPFYYLYLKFFMHFFGNSDYMLRITSIIPGVLSILSMYFVGKEFKDEKLGVLCASITSLSSFLIYFSQEVRFYGLVFLFASLALLYTLKLLKEQNAKNFIMFLIWSFLIIFTHTIGFVFVLFNFVFVSINIIKTRHAELPFPPEEGRAASNQHTQLDRSRNKFGMTVRLIVIFWSAFIILILISSPFIVKLFTNHPYSQWWGHFSLSKIDFLITDYFSPMLTNIVSAPDNFFYNLTLGFVIFAMLPALIALAGIAKALTIKENFIEKPHSLLTTHHSLFIICLTYLLVLIIAAITGKLMFITKYSIEIYPTLILLMGFGLLEFNKLWKYLLIFSYCFLSMFYILTDSNSAPKMHRSEGHRLAAKLLNNAKINKGDLILINYYPKERFEKYFDFNGYRVISINKGNFSDYLGPQNPEIVFASNDNKYFNKKFAEEITNKLKPGQKAAILILDDVAVYSPLQLQLITKKKKEYKKAPFLFMAFSYIKNQELAQGFKNLQPLRFEQRGSWSIITFSKKAALNQK